MQEHEAVDAQLFAFMLLLCEIDKAEQAGEGLRTRALTLARGNVHLPDHQVASILRRGHRDTFAREGPDFLEAKGSL